MLPTEPIGGGGGGGSGGGGSSGGTNNIGTAIFNLNFNKHEAGSVLRIMAYANCLSGDDLQFSAYLTVNGVIRQAGTVNAIFDTTNSNAAMPITLPVFITDLGAGTHNIVFSIRNKEPDSALTVSQGSTIEVTELKQAAL